MQPEEIARQINRQDARCCCGCQFQHYRNLNLGAGTGVAVREFPLKRGFADYMLFVERR